MEPYIKDNINDISYMSELTPPSKRNRLVILGIEGGVKFADGLRPTIYVAANVLHKSSAHLK